MSLSFSADVAEHLAQAFGLEWLRKIAQVLAIAPKHSCIRVNSLISSREVVEFHYSLLDYPFLLCMPFIFLMPPGCYQHSRLQTGRSRNFEVQSARRDPRGP